MARLRFDDVTRKIDELILGCRLVSMYTKVHRTVAASTVSSTHGLSIDHWSSCLMAPVSST